MTEQNMIELLWNQPVFEWNEVFFRPISREVTKRKLVGVKFVIFQCIVHLLKLQRLGRPVR